MRKIVIKTRFGEVELSSDKRSEKMVDLVGNALQISAQLVPKEKEKEIPPYIR